MIADDYNYKLNKNSITVQLDSKRYSKSMNLLRVIRGDNFHV